MTDVGNAKDVAAKRKRRKEYDQLMKAGLTAYLNSYEGRMFFYELLGDLRFGKTSFVGEAPYTMAFNEGERNAAGKIFEKLLTAKPDVYTIMIKEAEDRKRGEETDG